MMIVRPQIRGRIDCFKVTQNGCQIRLYPELDANGKPLPIRYGRELSDAGNWVNADHYGISMLGGGGPGKEMVTMLLSVKGDDKVADPSHRRGLRIWDKLRSTAYYATDNNQCPSHWHAWVRNNYPSPTVLGTKHSSKAKVMTFARGCLTHYMTSKGAMKGISQTHPRSPCLFMFGSNAQDALRELFMAPLPGAENVHTDEWAKVFKYERQLCDPEHGCLINFGGKGQTNPETSYQNQLLSAPRGPVSFGSAEKSKAASSDGDQFVVEATLLTKMVYPIPMDVIREAWQWSWDDLLMIYATEKDLLAALEVGFPDELIIEAFKDEPHLLSDRLRTMLGEVRTGSGRFPAPEQRMAGFPSPSYGANRAPARPAASPNTYEPVQPAWTSNQASPAQQAQPAQPAHTGPVFHGPGRGNAPLSQPAKAPSGPSAPASTGAPSGDDDLQNMLNTINRLGQSQAQDEGPF